MAEILFNAGKFADRNNAIHLIRWAIHRPITGAGVHQAIINGAETAERMGDSPLVVSF